MKLKFELKRANIEHLHKLLQLTSQIWANQDKIYFYFDVDQMIIYPENRAGFDKVFARIHINNCNPKGLDVSKTHPSSNLFFGAFSDQYFLILLGIKFLRSIPNQVSKREVSHSNFAP